MLLGAASSAMIILGPPDKRHQDEEWSDNEDLFNPSPYWSFDWNSPVEAAGFCSPWWPSRGWLLGGSGDGLEGDNLRFIGAQHGDMWRSFGANGRLAFVGITRDAYGSPLGGCTVRCFRTATDELVSLVYSDAYGNYAATTPYFESHYLVVHKSGSPEVAGASVTTLTPA